MAFFWAMPKEARDAFMIEMNTRKAVGTNKGKRGGKEGKRGW